MKMKEVFLNPSNLFFTSDTHFFHENIIEYCERPYESKEKMNESLIENWNSVVSEGDTVFHLGDFSLGAKRGHLFNVLNRLNGHIYLIIGNHEKDILSKESTRSRFEGIYDILEITISDSEVSSKQQDIVLCHYPMLAWNKSHKGSWQLFGHVHGGLSNKGKIQHKASQLDVGVDCMDYRPVSYQEVKTLITKQGLGLK